MRKIVYMEWVKLKARAECEIGGSGVTPVTIDEWPEAREAVDINAFNNNGQTALHRAAQRGADQVVKFLAEHGAKLDMKDKQNRTPVDMALLPTPDPGNTPKPGHLATAALLRQYMSQ